MQHLRHLGAASLLLALTACGGRTSVSGADEAGAPATLGRQLEEQVGIYADDYLGNYVDGVGRRLVAEFGRDRYAFRFRVTDQAEPAAYATPEGHLYFSRGLLALLNSEDELAGLLAHQIAHVTAGDPGNRAGAGLAAALAPGGRVFETIVRPDLLEVMGPAVAAIGGWSAGAYSSEQERRADEAGMALVARAGYDPAGLPAVLSTLQRLHAAADADMSAFFDTHPIGSGRLAAATGFAATQTWRAAPKFAPDRASFLRYLDRLVWGPGNPTQGVFEGQRFLQPDLAFTLEFPAGWRTVNTPRFVGAFAPANAALLIVGTAGGSPDPSEQARAFVEELEDRTGQVPLESRPLQLGGWPGHLVRIADDGPGGPSSIAYLWVRSPRLMFQLIGAGPARYEGELAGAVESLRPLDPAERDAVSWMRLAIAETTAGETLEELSARTANAWTPAFTAVANGLPEDPALPTGTLVKIVGRSRYR